MLETSRHVYLKFQWKIEPVNNSVYYKAKTYFHKCI